MPIYNSFNHRQRDDRHPRQCHRGRNLASIPVDIHARAQTHTHTHQEMEDSSSTFSSLGVLWVSVVQHSSAEANEISALELLVALLRPHGSAAAKAQALRLLSPLHQRALKVVAAGKEGLYIAPD